MEIFAFYENVIHKAEGRSVITNKNADGKRFRKQKTVIALAQEESGVYRS